jgi:Na+-transporting NADH:ubiquinone oxidoreductase subunit NqrB
MLNIIDRWLNQITMYRLLLAGLLAVFAYATMLGFLNILPYSGLQFVSSGLVLLASCYLSNWIFAKITGATTNIESFGITALILFCIVAPPSKTAEFLLLMAVATVAMASKYILAIGKKHVFNPAAIALVILGLLGSGESIWWIGTSSMLPITVILGLLVIHKIRRFSLLISFLISALQISSRAPSLPGRSYSWALSC